MTIAERWSALRDRIGEAAVRVGRSPDEVVVVAAAKTFAAADVREAIAAGARDVGENYVQEAVTKRGAVRAPARWHLIGRLQRNKAGRAVETFDWIHSLDSLELIDAVDRAATRSGRRVRGLVQVNLGGEASKGGVAPEELEGLCTALAGRCAVTIEGLMTVPPPVARAEENRRHFARMRELRELVSRLRLPGVQPKELSMGMSADFEVAVEEGATFVRIGTALFGSREPKR